MTDNSRNPKKPIYHDNHKPILTRRDLIARGFASGIGYVFTPGILGLAADRAWGACAAAQGAALNPLPFMAIELAGGGNIGGSNIIVGGRGGQLNFLPAGGYGSLGLPPDQEPQTNAIESRINSEFGLAMHPNSAFLFGLLSVTSAPTRAAVEGFIIAGRSDDDTQNNPHNCVYWIQKSGARGQIVDLIGTDNTDSGARAAIPPASFNPSVRPTVVNNFNSAAGLISAETIQQQLGSAEHGKKILQAAAAMSEGRLKAFSAKTMADQVKELVKCGYLKAVENSSAFSPEALDPAQDPLIAPFRDQDPTVTAFTPAGLPARDFAQFDRGDTERIGAIAKLVLDGYAGAGSVVLGGYDYHNQGRTVQERRDFEAGRAAGIALEIANKKGKNLALYIYTDGGVSAGDPGQTEDNAQAGNKPQFTSDNGARSSAVMLVHKAGNKGRPALAEKSRRQLGFYDPSGAVGDDGTFVTSVSPVNVSKAIVLNYLALLGKEKDLAKIAGDNPFEEQLEKYVMFKKIV